MSIKKRLLPIFSTVFIPVTFLVSSCSTSWTKWNTKEGDQASIKFKNATAKHIEQYQIRKNLLSAYNFNANQDEVTVYLDKINNQYEFVQVIIDILNFKPSISIDTFWDNITDQDSQNDNDLPKFFKSLKQKLIFNLKSKIKSYSFQWDISDITDKIDNIYKARPISKPLLSITLDLNSGLPKNIVAVQRKGRSFLNFKSIKALLAKDSQFALKLSKLVNLPSDAFKEFNKFIESIDKLWENIYNKDGVNNLNNLWINSFEYIKNQSEILYNGIDFSIQSNGVVNTRYKNKYNNNFNSLIGEFISKGLKNN